MLEKKLLPRRIRDASLGRVDEEGDTRRDRMKPEPLRERLSFKDICYPKPVRRERERGLGIGEDVAWRHGG